MNDPALDIAVFYVLWFATGYIALRIWEARHRIYDWLLEANRRRW